MGGCNEKNTTNDMISIKIMRHHIGFGFIMPGVIPNPIPRVKPARMKRNLTIESIYRSE
jgi:hypothetical protein